MTPICTVSRASSNCLISLSISSNSAFTSKACGMESCVRPVNTYLAASAST